MTPVTGGRSSPYEQTYRAGRCGAMWTVGCAVLCAPVYVARQGARNSKGVVLDAQRAFAGCDAINSLIAEAPES